MASVQFSEDWRIAAPPQTDPVADFAVTELRTALESITGFSPAITSRAREGIPTIALSHLGRAGDGFRWEVHPDRILIEGQSPRGLLFGVYSLLEALGCRWPAPGIDVLPAVTRFTLPDDPIVEQPALPGRALILGHWVFLEQAERWIAWAARNRLNTVFFHTTEEPLAMGAAPERQYQRIKGAALRAARQRGLIVEHGGHGLAALLPRRLFRQMPDAFREHNSRRTPDHNFCPTSEAGMAVIRANAEAHFRAHPEVDVFHLWADDIAGGGWCSCARCQGLSPSEQALLATNAIAEVLAGVNPAAQTSFLAYHDTEDVPRRVQPRPNVHMLWAPRMREYARSIDHPDSAVNSPRYPETFRAQVAHFQAAGAQPARAFEYYLDGILFKSVLPPLPGVIKADLRFYRSAGAHTAGVLMTGTRPWLAPQINAYLFARLCWNPDQDLLALVREFCRAAFDCDSPDLVASYRDLEQAFSRALALTPETAIPEFGMQRPLESPPVDMGDPFRAPRPVLIDRAGRASEVEALAENARAAFDRAWDTWAAGHPTGPPTAHSAAWWGQMEELTLIQDWLRFDAARVRLYHALSGETPKTTAKHHLGQAEFYLQRVLEWGAGPARIEHPAVRANFALLHRAMWGLRLVRVRLDHFSRGLGGLWLRISTLLELRRLAARVRRAYR